MDYPSSNNNLDYGMLYEILSRASLEAVDKCKILSKEVQELINDPWFVKNHIRTMKTVLGYFVETIQCSGHRTTFVSVDNQSILFKCLTDDMGILASSCQGILCCRNRDEYFVCKPSTNQLVTLPSPKRKPESYSMSEHVALIVEKSKPLRYKIVRFFDARHSPPGKNAHVCEVFDSEIWTWRGVSNNLITDQGVYFMPRQAVTIGRTAFWLMTNNTVLAFDSTTDTYSQFPVPEILNHDERYRNKQIVNYKGKLGYTCVYDWKRLLLWGVEDSENHKWKIKKVVRIDQVERKLEGCDLTDIGLMTGYEEQVFKLSGSLYAKIIFPFRSDCNTVDLEDGCNMLKPLEF